MRRLCWVARLYLPGLLQLGTKSLSVVPLSRRCARADNQVRMLLHTGWQVISRQLKAANRNLQRATIGFCSLLQRTARSSPRLPFTALTRLEAESSQAVVLSTTHVTRMKANCEDAPYITDKVGAAGATIPQDLAAFATLSLGTCACHVHSRSARGGTAGALLQLLNTTPLAITDSGPVFNLGVHPVLCAS